MLRLKGGINPKKNDILHVQIAGRIKKLRILQNLVLHCEIM